MIAILTKAHVFTMVQPKKIAVVTYGCIKLYLALYLSLSTKKKPRQGLYHVFSEIIGQDLARIDTD